MQTLTVKEEGKKYSERWKEIEESKYICYIFIVFYDTYLYGDAYVSMDVCLCMCMCVLCVCV